MTVDTKHDGASGGIDNRGGDENISARVAVLV